MPGTSRKALMREALWAEYAADLIGEDELDKELDRLYAVPLDPVERTAWEARLEQYRFDARARQQAVEAQNAEAQARWPDEWEATRAMKTHERQAARRELRARLT